MRLFFLFSLCVLATPALSQTLELRGLIIVGKSQSASHWSNQPTEVRRDDPAELAVIGVAKEGKQTIYLADQDLTALLINKKSIPATQLRPWSSIGNIETRWSYIEPSPWRSLSKPLKKGPDVLYYSNVIADGPKLGKWLGFDEISYFETEANPWSALDSARRRPATATPPRKEDDIFGGLGTMRYKVELRLTDGTILSTAGAEAHDIYGVLPSVHRVSIRKDDSYLGYMTSYFLVPKVFGSSGGGKNNQTDRYVGADCADVLVGGLRAKGIKVKYSFVAGLTKYADVIVKPHDLNAAGEVDGDPIIEAKVGDLIRINYSGRASDTSPRSWDHVALWYEDKSDPKGSDKGGPDNKFDGFDLVMHMSQPYLTIEPFSEQTPATIDVLRWKKSLKVEPTL
jgi:hypothetical protein